VRHAGYAPLPLTLEDCPHGHLPNCLQCLHWYAAAHRAWYASRHISPWPTGETAMRRARLDAAQALRELQAWRRLC